MQTFTTEQMGDFVEFWAKAKKSYGFNSALNFEDVLKEISDLDYWQKNRVVDGLIYSAPTTPSTQGSGAVPAVWKVKIVPGYTTIKGGMVNSNVVFGASGDIYIDNQYHVTLPALGVGQSVIAAVIGMSYMSGLIETPSLQTVLGTPATTGTEQPPTDAEIEAFLANDDDLPGYIKIAKLTLNRTGDTTVTQTQDNTWRDV